MVFGKRKHVDTSLNDEDEDDLTMFENNAISDDEGVEEIKVDNEGVESDVHTNNSSQPTEKRVDSNLKPLLEEVILKGVAGGKNPGGAKQWECKHCKSTFISTYTRIHGHFFGASVGKKAEIKRCPAMLKDRVEFERIRKKVENAERAGISSSLKNSKLIRRQVPKNIGPLEESFALMDRQAVDAIIVRALCANGIPFNVLRNPQFCQMVTAINRGPKGYKAPSFEKSRTTLLDEVKTNVEKELLPVKSTWYTDSVSIVSDGWSNVKHNPLINILAVNSRGGMFLYAEDYSGIEKTGINIAKLLLQAIDEVGPSNVIQVVTDNATNCKVAGKEVEKVHPHIFWSPCVVHTLNLIFKDLAQSFDWFSNTYAKGKKIVKYFINHSHALTIFRAHSKLELLKVAKTRFASHYIMLKRLLDVREALATTVVLNSWKELMKGSDENTRDVGALITGFIGNDGFWDEVLNIVTITKPIYKLIKLCDKDGPIMGEIYEGMDNMLGEIKDVMKNNKYGDAYAQIEAIVLGRWEKMNVPMHCLGFALSPRFYDAHYVSTPAPGGTTRKRPNEDKEVVAGVLKAFEKIASVPEEARMLRKQYVDFHMKRGLYATAAAFIDAATMDAIEWWATYGSETPELAEVARKVLSQPITSSSAERNWSTYSFIHNVKRNRLNSSRADKLVFIHSNIRLISRFQDDYKAGPFKKWDINPEDTIIDDSQVKLEEMRWKFLEGNNDDPHVEDSQLDGRTKDVASHDSTLRGLSSSPLVIPTNSAPRMRSQQSQISKFITRDAGGSSSSSKDKGRKIA